MNPKNTGSILRPEESKETSGFVVWDSKGNSVPFGARSCLRGLVRYTFILTTDAGNGVRISMRSLLPAFFAVKGCS